MGYVDADAHVIENGKTWDYLALTEQEYRPRTAEITEIGSSGGAPARRRWVVGDEYTVRHPMTDSMRRDVISHRDDRSF